MHPAHASRLAKNANPDDYCPDRRCLWRTRARDGFRPCPRHMQADYRRALAREEAEEAILAEEHARNIIDHHADYRSQVI